MGLIAQIKLATDKPWTTLYLRILGCILLYGGFVHIGNIAGWNGTPWEEFPYLWRFMDIILLIFDISVATGLFIKSPTAIVAVVVGLGLFQFVPYTFFRSHFVTKPEDNAILNGMLGMEATLLLILFLLIYFKK